MTMLPQLHVKLQHNFTSLARCLKITSTVIIITTTTLFHTNQLPCHVQIYIIIILSVTIMLQQTLTSNFMSQEIQPEVPQLTAVSFDAVLQCYS